MSLFVQGLSFIHVKLPLPHAGPYNIFVYSMICTKVLTVSIKDLKDSQVILQVRRVVFSCSRDEEHVCVWISITHAAGT